MWKSAPVGCLGQVRCLDKLKWYDPLFPGLFIDCNRLEKGRELDVLGRV
jgi:hypothetical protein